MMNSPYIQQMTNNQATGCPPAHADQPRFIEAMDDKRADKHLRHLVLCGEMMLMKLEDLAPDDESLDSWRGALEMLRNSKNG